MNTTSEELIIENQFGKHIWTITHNINNGAGKYKMICHMTRNIKQGTGGFPMFSDDLQELIEYAKASANFDPTTARTIATMKL